MNGKRNGRFTPRFVLPLILAGGSLAILLGMLAGSRNVAYAVSVRPLPAAEGDQAVPDLLPPLEPARSPIASPPVAPLSQGGDGPSVITVCASCPCTTVQAAVSTVAPGGLVKVAQGVYTDTDGDGRVVYITKTLTLQGGYTTTNWTTPDPGAYPTALDGESGAQVVYVADGIAPTIEGFHIHSGFATNGGGVYVAGGEPVLRRNRIYSNTATNNGGGVYVVGGEPVLENNLVYTNTAAQKRGGGVYVASGIPLLHHNTLYGNWADSEGGGVYVNSGSPVISATIIVSNVASDGGGIYRYGGTPALGYNDVWGNSPVDYSGVTGGTGSISEDPSFVDPAGADFRLQAGSPCIDQVPVAQTVGVDYDGWARPFGEQSDIGAHEFYTGTCFARVGSGQVYTSVQAAVDATTGGDMVKVAGVCQGVLTRTVGVDTFTQTVYISQGLTLRGGYTVTNWSTPDPDAHITALDAQGQGRVVYVDSTAAVVVEGFHIRSGLVTGLTTDDGGGIYLEGGGAHIVRQNQIYSNTADNDGGGLYVVTGDVRVYGNEIYSNTARGNDTDGGGGGGGYLKSGLLYANVIHDNRVAPAEDSGGGVYASDSMVQDNTIYSNTAEGNGGGIYADNATVQGNIIYSNTADKEFGGGVYADGAMVQDNFIYSNTAPRAGGGIHIHSSSTGNSVLDNEIHDNKVIGSGQHPGGGGISVWEGANVTIRSNSIYSNTATGDGGGVYFYLVADGTVEQNTIYGNMVTTRGGGVYISTGDVQLENNLIYSNTGSLGGGGVCINVADYPQDDDPTLVNNTIYGNTASSNGGGVYVRDDDDSQVTIIRNTIVVSNTGVGIFNNNLGIVPTLVYNDVWGNSGGDYSGASAGTGSISNDPLFVDPAGADFHLQSGSPCIDTADPNNYPSDDYAGYARPLGLRADMGAYESYPGTCFVRIGSSQVYTAVQTAVDAAASGARVLVAGVCQDLLTRTADGGTFTQTVYISQALTLRGGYTITNWFTPTTQTVLDAQGLGRAVYITGTGVVTVDGFIVRGGEAITGGGLYVATALNPTIQNTIFYSNTASHGGGFGSAGGNPRLYNNTFVTNTATYSGGAVYLDAGFPIISNTIVVSNTGGGLYATADATPTLAYNDVWQNAGGNYAGNVTTGTTDFSTAPLFVDFTGRDFHLQPDSPCVHTADPGTGLTLDFEGDARPLGRGYDVGADESDSYPDVAFAPKYLSASGIPGQQVVHNHTLTNTGSISDTFDLTHTMTISGLATGWVVDYTPAFALAAGEVAASPAAVGVPVDAVSGTYAIVILTATSRVNGTIYDVVSNTTVANWNPGVLLAPAYTEHVNPGTVMTYVHTLTNTGNAPDTFNFTFSNVQGWSGVTPTQVVDLGPQMTATLWVSVAVPATAPGGLIETTILTATGDSTVWAVVTDTTDVNHTPGTRYVATTGIATDTLNNCLVFDSPCSTVAYAVGQATSGDIVEVAAGTYDEYDVTLNKDVTLRGGYSADFSAWDPDDYPTILDAKGLGRVLNIFGSPTVEGFTLQGGSSPGSGGGVYIALGSPILRRNVITGNTAGAYGGGVYNGPGNPTLERNVLAFNAAQRGGGFASDSGNPAFWSNLVYENTAGADGGGVYIAGGSPRIWHDTVYSNTADTGGGLYLAGGSPVVSNTIVISNTASVAGGVYSQAAGAALEYNDVWGNANGDYVGLSAGSHSISANPIFEDAAREDLHLQEGSPCIDIGDVTALEEDIDGHPRAMGDAPDIGADEFLQPWVELEPDRASSGYPGDTLLYAHTLTNTGSRSDTFAFTAQSSQGWDVTLPGAVELGAGFTATVEVQVEIPAGTLSGTLDTTVVTATSELNDAIFDTAVDTTTVGLARDVLLEPYHASWVDSDPWQPVQVVYTHRLTNTGNYTDTFGLAWESSQGLAVVVAPTGATLGGGVGTAIYVTVTVPPIPTDTVLVDTTVITATSQSVITVTDPATDTTYVNLQLGVELAPDREGSDVPGNTVYYTHTLTNTGNYTDTFTFEAQSSQGWTVTPPDPTELGSGLTTMVQVGVQIPGGTLSNTVDTTVVTATSQFSATVSASVMDVTTVEQAPAVSLEREWLDAERWCVQSPPTTTVDYLFTLSNGGNYTDTFDITAQSSNGWDVTVVPISATLASDASTVIWVQVQVPSTTAQFLDTVTVVATSRADGSVSDSAYYMTRVNWDVNVELEPNNSGAVFLEDSILYTHTLTNTGTETNTIGLTGKSSQGWDVTVSPDTVELGPGETEMVEVMVTVHLSVISVTDTTVITASTTEYCLAHDIAVDTTTVARPHVTLEPDHSQSAAPGTVVTYTHVLSNSGAVSDTYTITYTSSLGWATSVTPTVVYTLSPGSAVPVTGTVSVPAGILSGTIDMLVITATSQFTTTIFDIATDETTVPYVPGAVIAPDRNGQADPGGTITYTHVLTNTGNYTETFDLTTHSEFGYAEVSPATVVGLGPGMAYTGVQVVVRIPAHTAAGEIEQTEVIATFAGQQEVAVDSTTVNAISRPRYVAPNGTDENNNCTDLGYNPCATVQYAVDCALTGDEVRVAQGVYTDVHTTGGYTQVVYLDKRLTLRGGYAITDWDSSDPMAHSTVLDAGGQGRVVYVAGDITPTIEGFHLWRGNVNGDGAGLYIAAGTVPTVRSNLIYSNTASGAESKGGGVYYAGGGSPLLERNIVYGNAAEDGGGFYIASGSPAVWNNVVYHNAADDLGGGLYSGGSPTVWNNTFYSNTANSGGGIYVAAGSPVVSDTIVAENAQYGIYNAGGSPALAYNLVWVNSPANFHNVIPGSETITTTPRFVDAASGDLHLWGDSPAINAGDPNAIQPVDDRDGNPRPLRGCHDVGAYEYGLVSAKTVAPAISLPGESITYTIILTNTGSAAVEGVPIIDTLHTYLDYAGLLTYTTGSGEYVTATRTISWTGDVAGDSTIYVTFTASSAGWLAAGIPITNVAWVDSAATGVVTTVVGATPGTRYVAVALASDDADNNCLQPEKPCATVQYAVGQTMDGDAVRVATGVYTDALNAGQVVSVAHSIALLGGYTSTTWANDPEAYPTYLDGQNAGRAVVITGPVTVTLAGFRIEGGTGGGVYANTATAVISRCRVYRNTGDGIHVMGGDLALERTWVYSNTGDGVGVNDGTFALVNNVIAHNEGAGLLTTEVSTGSLRHNTFAHNTVAGAVVSGTAHFTNTIFYSHTVGVSLPVGYAGLWNTLWWQNLTDTLGAVVSATNVYSDPVFYDPDVLDYHIGSGSGAIDTGVEAGVSEDIDGGPRPLLEGYDIGADEFSLQVTRFATPTAALPCARVTHTLMLTNLQGMPLDGMWISETLPAEVGYVTATLDSSTGSYGFASGVITWTGTVTDTVLITFAVQLNPYLADGTAIIHTATVGDSVSVFGDLPLTVMVETLEAQLGKTAPAQATIGQVITYTVAYTVPAGHVAYQPVVVDTLPRLITGSGISTTPALTYVVGSASTCPVTVSADGGAITCALSTVTAACDAPETVTVTFAAQVRGLPDNDAGDLLTNTVAFSYTETTATGPAHFITATWTTTLVEPQVSITKTITPAANLGSGDEVTITLTVSNTGTSILYDLVVTDTLPAGLTYLSGAPTPGVDGQRVIWTLGSLGMDQQQVYIVTAQVTGAVGAEDALVNIADIRGTSLPGDKAEEQVYTDTAQFTATTGYPDLVISKERDSAVCSPGQTITYTIRYTNTGVVWAENVRITDTLPVSVTNVLSATSAAATVEHVGQVITWTLSDPVSRTATGTIWVAATVLLSAQEGDVLTNTIGITTTTTELSTTNNVSFVIITVRLPSLSITKTAEPAVVPPGKLLTYTLTVSNAGLGEALGLFISDTVPADTAYQSCSGGDGCGESGGVVTWTVAALPGGGQGPVTFTVLVGSDVVSGTSIINQTYGVTCIQGVSATGTPVSTAVGLMGGV
ncbi:MAG: right-handed parallel beta-helix repeat-containing protein, partial [Anaerolineae bacterium]